MPGYPTVPVAPSGSWPAAGTRLGLVGTVMPPEVPDVDVGDWVDEEVEGEADDDRAAAPGTGEA